MYLSPALLNTLAAVIGVMAGARRWHHAAVRAQTADR